MAELVEQPASTGTPRTWSELRASVTWASVRRIADVRSWPAVRQFMLVLAALFVVKQVIFALVFPAFTGHDEVAHYAYLRVVATEHRLPLIPDLTMWRELNAAGQDTGEDRIPGELYRYCRFVTQDWFCDPDNPRWRNSPPYVVTFGGNLYPSGWIYTANHPPLYYYILTPLYWVTDGASPATQLYWFRLAAIPFGLLTVLFCYLSARALFPSDPFVAVVASTFVAFQTQVSYEASMLNNDVLSITTYSLALYLIILGVRDRFPRSICLLLGVTLGLSMLTKSTAVTAIGVAGLAILLTVGWRDWRGWLWRGVAVGVPLAILVAPWYIHLYDVYGNVSGFEQIRALQWWNFNGTKAPSFASMLFNLDFAAFRFRETWGEFGWRRIHLGDVLLWAIGLPLLVCVAGCVSYAIDLIRGWRDRGMSADRPQRWQVVVLLLLLVTCVSAYLAIIQFGTEFSLTQARYYFVAINAVAILLAVGLRALIPRPYRPYGQGAVLGLMVLLNVVILTQYVIPYWQLSN